MKADNKIMIMKPVIFSQKTANCTNARETNRYAGSCVIDFLLVPLTQDVPPLLSLSFSLSQPPYRQPYWMWISLPNNERTPLDTALLSPALHHNHNRHLSLSTTNSNAFGKKRKWPRLNRTGIEHLAAVRLRFTLILIEGAILTSTYTTR